MIVKILIAVLIFGITVIIHELGHFLLAKANGITVTEFSIGFGPTVVKTEKGGTVYSLKLLPFGGACQMLGEDGEEEGEGTFNSKSVWARISVVAAGVQHDSGIFLRNICDQLRGKFPGARHRSGRRFAGGRGRPGSGRYHHFL